MTGKKNIQPGVEKKTKEMKMTILVSVMTDGNLEAGILRECKLEGDQI